MGKGQAIIGIVGVDADSKKAVLDEVTSRLLGNEDLDIYPELHNVPGKLYDKRVIQASFDIGYTSHYLVLREFESRLLRTMYVQDNEKFLVASSFITPLDWLSIASCYEDLTKKQYSELRDMANFCSNCYSLLYYVNTGSRHSHALALNDIWNEYYRINKKGRKEFSGTNRVCDELCKEVDKLYVRDVFTGDIHVKNTVTG